MAAASHIAQQDMAVLPATLPIMTDLIPGLAYDIGFIWAQADCHANLTLSSGENVFIGLAQALHQLATTMLRNGQHLVCPRETFSLL